MFTMKRTPALLLSAAMAFNCTASLLKAEELDAEAQKNAVLFDHATQYAPKNAAAAAPAIEDKTQLAAKFKKRLKIDDHGNPAEKAALEAMILRMMDSPTAREKAAQFIKAGATAKVAFEEMPGSAIATVAGKKTVWGALGYTRTTDPPNVKLNKLFMKYASDKGISVLTREMLGHVLERKKVPNTLTDLYDMNMDEEENANLIGWLTAAELGSRPADEVWNYVQNPSEHMEASTDLTGSYALILNSDDMYIPELVYAQRLSAVEAKLDRYRNESHTNSYYLRFIDHLATAHKLNPASFRDIKDDINGDAIIIKKLEEVKKVLQDSLAFLKSDKGKVWIDKLAQAAGSDYFKQKDQAIKNYRDRLETL
ncbi:MAG: hypothetical protein WCW52_09950, partial [Elusimicrobiales bacterium]